MISHDDMMNTKFFEAKKNSLYIKNLNNKDSWKNKKKRKNEIIIRFSKIELFIFQVICLSKFILYKTISSYT